MAAVREADASEIAVTVGGVVSATVAPMERCTTGAETGANESAAGT